MSLQENHSKVWGSFWAVLDELYGIIGGNALVLMLNDIGLTKEEIVELGFDVDDVSRVLMEAEEE